MTQQHFPWENKSESNFKNIPIVVKKPITSTEGTIAQAYVESTDASTTQIAPKKPYGTGKPYRIKIKGDITCDSSNRGE